MEPFCFTDEVRASQLAQASERGWSLPLRPEHLVETSGKVFNPFVKLVLENQPLSDALLMYITSEESGYSYSDEDHNKPFTNIRTLRYGG